MNTLPFSALGTEWSIVVDHDTFGDEDKKAILEAIATFENRFSRFRMESEVNAFRTASAGTYEISEEFSRLLHRARELQHLTKGVYDPALGRLLEQAGYDASYRLTADDEVATFQLPVWSIVGRDLTIDGPVVFDFGGIGKGYCIDRVSLHLQRLGYEYFLVEGGGDMYGTTKRDGTPYRVALEWPGKVDTAFGILALDHQGVAVSDSFKRRWQKGWHHIIDPHTKKPIEAILGCTAVAPNAFAADCMTSGLFLSSPKSYQSLSDALEAEFVVFKADGTAQVSKNWPGELF